MNIRTRFAPSPTGFLHVGGLRTALYNYLFTKQNNGKFILRIEDTDQNRYVENATDNLINILSKFGFNYDIGPGKEDENGPYVQSKRLNIYKKYYMKLLKNNSAYVCFDIDGDLIPEFDNEIALSKMNSTKYVIKLKINKNSSLKINDLIRGDIEFDLNLIDDPIIIKSDGFPTYHFANVIDDHLMKITHVIRGEEWISSLPKHVTLYNAFNWKLPQFCHLPLLLNEDKSKLSKRQGDVAVEDFINKGYLKKALINFVALLGWHPDNDNELFLLEDLIKHFSIDRVNKSGAIFDREKLIWMNREYIKKIDDSEMIEIIKSKLKLIDIHDSRIDLKKLSKFCKNRINRLDQIIDEIKGFYFYKENQDLNKFEFSKLFRLWVEKLSSIKIIDKDTINDLVNASKKDLNISGKNLFIPLRIALTSQTHGADIFTIIDILGIKESIRRIERFCK
jgi:glutamyl-tRNA synthetase